MRIESGYNNARLVSLDGRYAVEIELTQGKTTLIDLSDWEEARHLRWYTVRHKKKFYAQAAPAGCDYIYLHTFLIGRPSVPRILHGEHSEPEHPSRLRPGCSSVPHVV